MFTFSHYFIRSEAQKSRRLPDLLIGDLISNRRRTRDGVVSDINICRWIGMVSIAFQLNIELTVVGLHIRASSTSIYRTDLLLLRLKVRKLIYSCVLLSLNPSHLCSEAIYIFHTSQSDMCNSTINMLNGIHPAFWNVSEILYCDMNDIIKVYLPIELVLLLMEAGLWGGWGSMGLRQSDNPCYRSAMLPWGGGLSRQLRRLTLAC